jgi:predicted GH43/DUF377 family glycosyl hydrolase
MVLAQPFQVLRPSGPFAELDRHRAWRPSVLRGDGAVLRMWYGGHDGSVSRVLAAEQRPRDGWTRLGVSVDTGLAGPSDAGGTDAPSVVRTPTGFVMAYVGSDGAATRVHLARSVDGTGWQSCGAFRAPGGQDATATPCLVWAKGRLWLYYTGRDEGGRASVFAATSTDGADWSDAGLVFGPPGDDHGVSDPWIVADDDEFLMLYLRAGERHPSVSLATSTDGMAWSPRAPLDLGRRHHDAGSIGGPSAMRLPGGPLRVWYAAANEGDTSGGCRLWSADVTGKLP